MHRGSVAELDSSHLQGIMLRSRSGLETYVSSRSRLDGRRSRSRSRLGQIGKRLGLVSVSRADVSVSSRSPEYRSRAHPWLFLHLSFTLVLKPTSSIIHIPLSLLYLQDGYSGFRPGSPFISFSLSQSLTFIFIHPTIFIYG